MPPLITELLESAGEAAVEAILRKLAIHLTSGAPLSDVLSEEERGQITRAHARVLARERLAAAHPAPSKP